MSYVGLPPFESYSPILVKRTLTAKTARSKSFLHLQGSCRRRYSHSSPIFCIITGALFKEPEITSKVLKRGYRIYEVPISYNGREYDEGKKISWRDGLTVMWTLLKYRLTE